MNKEFSVTHLTTNVVSCIAIIQSKSVSFIKIPVLNLNLYLNTCPLKYLRYQRWVK